MCPFYHPSEKWTHSNTMYTSVRWTSVHITSIYHCVINPPKIRVGNKICVEGFRVRGKVNNQIIYFYECLMAIFLNCQIGNHYINDTKTNFMFAFHIWGWRCEMPFTWPIASPRTDKRDTYQHLSIFGCSLARSWGNFRSLLRRLRLQSIVDVRFGALHHKIVLF